MATPAQLRQQREISIQRNTAQYQGYIDDILGGQSYVPPEDRQRYVDFYKEGLRDSIAQIDGIYERALAGTPTEAFNELSFRDSASQLTGRVSGGSVNSPIS